MSLKQLIFIALICMSAAILMPQEAIATTTDGELFKGVAAQADKIKDFLFGTAMRFMGALGAFYGSLRSIFSNSISPFLTFGGIGIGVMLIPKFLDGVFVVSGILIQ